MTSRPQRSNPGSVGHQNALTVAATGRTRSTKVASGVAKVANRAAKVASRVAPIVTSSSAAAPLPRSVEAVADDALADARQPEAAEAAAAEVLAEAEPAARGRRHLLLPVVARCAVARKAVGKETPGQAATSEVPSAACVVGDPAASAAEVPACLLGAEPDGEDVLEECLGVAVRERGPGVGRSGGRLSLFRASDRRGRRRRRRG